MVTWEFRVIKHDLPTDKKVWFGLHEVSFNEKGRIENWTVFPCLEGASFEYITEEVDRIVRDMKICPEALNLSDLENDKK